MKMKRKLAMMLSALMLATAAMPAIADQAELIEPVEPIAEGAQQTIAAPGASISTAEDSVTLLITGQEGWRFMPRWAMNCARDFMLEAA